MKKLLFVFNPVAGNGKLRTSMFSILCAMAEAGYEITTHPTQHRGDATQLVQREGHKFDRIICAGGDGTLNEVVQGLISIENAPSLGYIPCGTTNDFASSLKLPKNNPLAAAKRALHPNHIFPCDVGAFNDRIFNYVAAFGSFTDVSYNTPQKVKNTFGYLAYVLQGVQALPELHPWTITVKTPKKEWTEDILLGLITNSTSVAGIHLKKDGNVMLDDGIFETVLVRFPHNLADIGALSAAVLARDYSSPLLMRLSIKELTIISEQQMPWTLDGEYGGSPTLADIRVLPRAINICI